MSNTLRIKRRAVGGASGAPASLENAELAFSEVDDILYYGKGTGGGATVVAIGGLGAFANLTSNQTIGGTKTFSNAISGSITGTAANVTGIVAIANGGTGASDAPTALTNLGAYAASNPSGFTSNAGTVTSVGGTGTVSGLTLTGTVTAAGNLTLGGTLAVAASDFASQSANSILAAPDGSSGTPTFRTLVAGDIPNLAGEKITSGTVAAARLPALNAITAPTADVALNGFKITGLATPISDSDAATKGYVDASRAGLDVKDSVRAATTADITLSGAQTIDGVSLVAGNRVLVKNQAAPAENGIYVVVDPGAWTRSSDANISSEVTAGMFTFVEEGTVNADKGFVLSTNDTIVLGTTALSFAQFSGSGTITAGTGLTKTGDVIAIDSTVATLGGTQSFTGVKTFDQTIVGSVSGSAATLTTGRTLTIGSTGKSFDGSAAVSWSLGEIGAAAVDQTVHIGTTAVAINRTSAPLTLTGITLDGGTF